MEWYIYVALISAFTCLSVFIYRLIYLLSLGMPKDLSQETGSVKKGIIYSFTGAMSPTAKESAYLHLPTYVAGLLYHAGIFTSLLFFVWTVISVTTDIETPDIIGKLLTIVLIITSVAGLSIFIKRVASAELRFLSCADDYISNLLSTLSQIAAIIYLNTNAELIYFVIMAILFLWMPWGKTKHLLYFFFARIHLGFFYGRRNAWPTVHKS